MAAGNRSFSDSNNYVKDDSNKNGSFNNVHINSNEYSEMNECWKDSYNEGGVTLNDSDEIFCDARMAAEMLYCQVEELLRFEVEVSVINSCTLISNYNVSVIV